MSKNQINIKKVLTISFVILFSLVSKAQIKYLDPYAKYSANTELLLNLPTLTTISSTSLVINCEYTPELIQGWASDKVIDAIGVIWSDDSNQIETALELSKKLPGVSRKYWPYELNYIRSMKNLNVMHKITGSNNWYDTHEGLFNEGTNKKFSMSVAPSRGISFVIGDNGAVCIDAVGNTTDIKTFRSDVLKPGTKYYIRAFVLYHPGDGWASRYDCIYSPIQEFTTADVNHVDNNYLFFPKKTLVCSNILIDPINGTQVTGGTGTYNYSWQSSNGNGVWTSISGATGMSYTPVYPTGINVPTKTWYRRIVSSTGASVTTSTSAPVNYVFLPANYSCDPVYDADLNPYIATIIGAQTWLTENLITTRFSDNTSIPDLTSSTLWTTATTPAYSQNLSAPEAVGAKLYNWYVVNGTTKNACPTGYHASTLSDWNDLISAKGGTATAALSLKSESYWQSDSQKGNNSNSFFATPDGWKNYNTNEFRYLNEMGAWWIKNADGDNTTIKDPYMQSGYARVIISDKTGDANKRYGFSIRCVKNK